MLALLRVSISDEEMVAIIRQLVEKACAGDVSAAKLIMSYKLGKPAAAPNPDEIDRDEWEHYQRDTINLDEVQQVLGSMPARVGNDIARTALPIMAQSQKDALANQLVKDQSAARKVTKEKAVTEQITQEHAPIPNGNSSENESPILGSPSSIHDRRTTIHDSRSTIHDQRPTISESTPIRNGNSRKKRRKGTFRAAPATQKKRAG
jgi:hypothetical protein